MHGRVHVGGLSAKVGLLCECYGRVGWPCGLHGCCTRSWSATLTKLCVGKAQCSKKHMLSLRNIGSSTHNCTMLFMSCCQYPAVPNLPLTSHSEHTQKIITTSCPTLEKTDDVVCGVKYETKMRNVVVSLMGIKDSKMGMVMNLVGMKNVER